MKGPIRIAALAIALAATVAASEARAQFRTLVRIGDPVPATDLEFADLEAPVIGPDGAIAFIGLLERDGLAIATDVDEGLFVYQAVGSEIRRFLVFREGEELPTAGGPTIGVPEHRLMGDGRLVMRAFYDVDDPGPGNIGVWTWGQGDAAPTPLALRRGPIAGDLQWGLLESLRASPSGTAVTWNGTIIDTSIPASIFAMGGTPGDEPPAVLLEARGPEEGPIFSDFDMRSHAASGNGHFAVGATVEQRMPDFESFDALIVDGGVAVRDDEAGLDDFEAIGINDAGQVLVVGLTGTLSPTRSLHLYRDGALQPIAAPGEAMPVAELSGATWGPASFNGARCLIGGGGHVAVAARIDGGPSGADDAVLVREPGGGWRLVAMDGQDAPGLAGITFAEVFPLSSSRRVLGTNAQGNVIVRATLAGEGVGTDNDDSLWGYDYSDDELVLLLREGQGLLVEGVPHVLTGFEVQLGSGGQDGMRTGYSDSGEIAMILRFEPVGGGTSFVGGGSAMGDAPIESAGPPGSPMPDTDGGTTDGDGGTAGPDAGVGGDDGDRDRDRDDDGCSAAGRPGARGRGAAAMLALLATFLLAIRPRRHAND